MKKLSILKGIIAGSILALSISAYSTGFAADTTQQKEAPKKNPDVIFVPTPMDAVEKMIEMAQIKKGDVLYDLGCGDGRIVVTAAKKIWNKGSRY